MKCEEVVEKYLAWLGNRFKAIPGERKGCRIITPFLTPENDPIVIHIEEIGAQKYKLTDKGFISSYWFLAGVELSTSRRTELLKDVIGESGIQYLNDELYIECLINDLEVSLHCIIGAMLTLSDFYLMAQEGEEISVQFAEEVKSYLDEQQKHYFFRRKVPGKAIEHDIDFIFNHRGMRYADTLQASNNFDAKVHTERLIFKFYDIRSLDSGFYGIAVYDDRKDVWASETMKILNEYADLTIPWSGKEKLLEIVVSRT